MKYDTVLFDLDGTLLDSLEDLADCVNYTMNLFGYPERTLEEVRTFVGNGIGMLVKRAVPEYVSKEQCEIVFAEFKKYYTENCIKKTKPYDGIIELLCQLKKIGVKLAIVTNKNQMAVNKLNNLFFNGIIDAAVGDDGRRERKPAPDSCMEALKLLGSEKGKPLYVGDSEVDIETAVNAGLDNVIVTWGFRSREQLMEAGGVNFIDKPEELLKFL